MQLARQMTDKCEVLKQQPPQPRAAMLALALLKSKLVEFDHARPLPPFTCAWDCDLVSDTLQTDPLYVDGLTPGCDNAINKRRRTIR